MNKHSGKVRDIYEIPPDRLVLVTTDRISAFDKILPKSVKGKGKILNEVSLYWFDYTKDIVPSHIISANLQDMPEFFRTDEFEGRAVLVKKLKILPFEFVVRGYAAGSLLAAGGYKFGEKLETPLFTPTTKAEKDEPVSFDFIAEKIGDDLAEGIKQISLQLYEKCNANAQEKGIIIADTKFEFGLDENGTLHLADEIFTPDSSRLWCATSGKAYDKQLLRDWLAQNKMQFNSVPDEIYKKIFEIYAEYKKIIAGSHTTRDKK